MIRVYSMYVHQAQGEWVESSHIQKCLVGYIWLQYKWVRESESVSEWDRGTKSRTDEWEWADGMKGASQSVSYVEYSESLSSFCRVSLPGLPPHCMLYWHELTFYPIEGVRFQKYIQCKSCPAVQDVMHGNVRTGVVMKPRKIWHIMQVIRWRHHNISIHLLSIILSSQLFIIL